MMNNAVAHCSGLPLGDEGQEPVFHAPWQAQAFAMVLELHRRGVFTWGEWASAFSARLALARPLLPTCSDSPAASLIIDSAEQYYLCWLAALEDLVQAKGAGTAAELQHYAQAWTHAAERTPHGRAIELQVQDFEAPSLMPSHTPSHTPSLPKGAA